MRLYFHLLKCVTQFAMCLFRIFYFNKLFMQIHLYEDESEGNVDFTVCVYAGTVCTRI